MSHHRADASALLDTRGYSGPLIRGVNPATLFEKAVRDRITDSYYWKEQCFGLNAATLCDRAVELSYIGGTYGLLQLAPEKEVILEYLDFHDPEADEEDSNAKGDNSGAEGNVEDAQDRADAAILKATGDFKYLRALAAFYVRLTFEPVEIYKTLEPLLTDYRKLKRRTKEGFLLTYMDQFVDDLLTKDRVCGTSLWKIPARTMLEDLDMLDERISPLNDELEDLDEESEKEDEKEERENGKETSASP
ncbi:pre-mRNA-splicing factor 38A [Nannizzia gypsea CBS 118893]|uniref:Pre-mRNA-splicing factor 38 n=1 Tax=Arthroderma gypseum (strain ATCC MYA-4604 / CBS 118893) TaxID=535722 RepID=E4UUK9_ARTGP|nr:pre-mRNA-splicing factor 38A [Nannizzia gypsea CBS 118893]EFR00976.1 pre-mRNA-splicing factor 38A [Nannizzia gypsea CBS 118893]